MKKEDSDILEKVRGYSSKILFVVNKTDRTDEEKLREIRERIPEVIEISVLEDYGIDNLEESILDYVNKSGIDADNQVIVTNARHKNFLTEALTVLNPLLTLRRAE